MSPTKRALYVLFGLIAAYDLATGAYLLLSDTPWAAHGPGTLWWDLAASGDRATLSLFRRLGALQIVAGAVTVSLLALGRRQTPVIDVMLGTYALAGLGLASTDRAFFDGTTYGLAKAGIGAACGIVMLAWLIARVRGKEPVSSP